MPMPRHPDVRSSLMSHPWSAQSSNLGDHWMTVNHLITRSYVLREEQRLSRWQHGRDFGPRFNEIIDLLQAPERSRVVVVDEPGKQEPGGFDVWTGPAWPTKRRWDMLAHRHGPICYQFDGISSPEKNPSAADLEHIVRCFGTGRSVCLGAAQSLDTIVRLLSMARLFVGVDSGMSHIAHSVGVPVIIVEYGLPVITCHRCKHFKHVRGTDELLTALAEYGG